MTRAAILALTILAAPALADDLTPPPWRFGPGTTVQHWDFSAGPVGGLPDAGPLFNPYGAPFFTPLGASFIPAFAGRTSIWDISTGALDFRIPNTGNPLNMKELWLQVTYFGPAPLTPAYSVFSTLGPFAAAGSIITPLPGGWVHELTRWTSQVCPPLESVSISGGIPGAQLFVDQVVIDTRCFLIPSPSSASLLACAGLVALRRRRA